VQNHLPAKRSLAAGEVFTVAITIPPFDQYQSPIVPLRGLWNAKPAEGDKFALVSIDWMVTTNNRAVQLLLSANSPVALSQIVALAVDNRRSGYDVDFLFPDSGFTLTVPAYNQGVFPVFTNALMFYVIAAEGVVSGNSLTFMVLNSMPPPVALNPTAMQTSEAVANISMTNGTTQIIPAGVNGSIHGFLITLEFADVGSALLALVDGAGTTIWTDTVTAGAQAVGQTISVTGINLRFVNGLSLVVSNSTMPGSNIASVNVFYTSP
jgi:hypothetical protein